MSNSKDEGIGIFNFAVSAYEWMDELFKSVGLVAGGLAASVADWVFGAITMTILMSKYEGFSTSQKWIAGGVFSLALWGIQIIMWRVILTGKIKEITNKKEMIVSMYIAVGIGILIMKFGDDLSDIVGVYWLIKDNPMQAVFNLALYKTLLVTIFFLTWAICGFAEVFVAISISLLKDDKKGGGQNNGQGNQGNKGFHFNRNNGHDRRKDERRDRNQTQQSKGGGQERLKLLQEQYRNEKPTQAQIRSFPVAGDEEENFQPYRPVSDESNRGQASFTRNR